MVFKPVCLWVPLVEADGAGRTLTAVTQWPCRAAGRDRLGGSEPWHSSWEPVIPHSCYFSPVCADHPVKCKNEVAFAFRASKRVLLYRYNWNINLPRCVHTGALRLLGSL